MYPSPLFATDARPPSLPNVNPPAMAALVNAASQLQRAVAPGELVTIHGTEIGPGKAVGIALDSDGNVATSAGTLRVFFDGKAAPLTYSSRSQINLIVPYEVAGKTATTISLEFDGMPSGSWQVPVVATAPAIFTSSSTGLGQGAILNQDNSVNASAKPAARNSVIQIFATGEGQTNPPGTTGSVTHSTSKFPLGAVRVLIGGIEANVRYAGSAPEAIAGLFQINAEIPANAPIADAVPILVKVGDAVSQPGVTVAIH